MKGIAIQTILLLLIGVLVAGLLVFYVYSFFSGSGMGKEECRTRAISWCTSCWNAELAAGASDDWSEDVGPEMSDELKTCAEKHFYLEIFGNPYIPIACNSPSGTFSRYWCSNFIPM